MIQTQAGAFCTKSSRSLPTICGFSYQKLILFFSDMLTLQAAALFVLWVRSLWNPVPMMPYSSIMLILLLGPVLNIFLGTCQTIALPPYKEVKQLFLATSMTYLVVLSFLFMTKSGDTVSRLVIVGAWVCSVFAVPLVRGRVRRWLCRKPWWGLPVIFFQKCPAMDELWRNLHDHPERGLRPVITLDISLHPEAETHAIEAMEQTAHAHPGAMGIFFVGDPHKGSIPSPALIKQASLRYKAILLISQFTMGENGYWLTPRDLGGAVGLLVRQNLLDTRRLRIKRCIDMLLTVCAGVIALPLGLILSLCVRWDSPGAAIYAHERLGQGGQRFSVYKFRTMVSDADAVLEKYLAANPGLREEWHTEQKLRDDPRITRVGAFLRKTSLDELPQLWNVFKGDMSLVGPRPIVDNEIHRYGKVYADYSLVKPGITGLWQVSGRNNTTYTERVRLDRYYVTNWSVWMDLWILARTIPVVLRGNGAY